MHTCLMPLWDRVYRASGFTPRALRLARPQAHVVGVYDVRCYEASLAAFALWCAGRRWATDDAAVLLHDDTPSQKQRNRRQAAHVLRTGAQDIVCRTSTPQSA